MTAYPEDVQEELRDAFHGNEDLKREKTYMLPTGEGDDGWDYQLKVFPQRMLASQDDMPSYDHVSARTRVVGFQEKQDKKKRKRLIRMVLEGDSSQEKRKKTDEGADYQ